MRVGVLASGRGSNFEALVTGARTYEVVVLVSNRPNAPVLERAHRLSVPAYVVPQAAGAAAAARNAWEEELAQRLIAASVHWVALAGFDRLLGPTFLAKFPDRIVNVHPSLLPAFPGRNAQAQALAHGVKITGCTVHRVDEYQDHGPILAQAAVPVLDGDTAETLAARILVEELKLYPATLNSLSQLLRMSLSSQ